MAIRPGAVKQTNESLGWVCWVCNQAKQRVIRLERTGQEFFCTDCLFDAIRDGSLVVSAAGAKTEATEQATTGVTLPVKTNDDGSVSVGDIEIRW